MRGIPEGSLVEWTSREGLVQTGVVVEHRRETYELGGYGLPLPLPLLPELTRVILDYAVVRTFDNEYHFPYESRTPARVVYAGVEQ